jgi:ATP-binding cassette subfamily B protein
MARRAKGGDRAGRKGGGGRQPRQTIKARLGTLKNLWPFLVMVWRISPGFTAVSVAIRIVEAMQPVATLFVGKLIIDEVVLLTQLPDKPGTLTAWLESGLLVRLSVLVAAELALAVLSDILGRILGLIDDLLGERVSNATSLKLMEHAATLDLADFENADFQDRLDRARRQTSNPLGMMWTLFRQGQDVLTGVSFAAGLVLYAPWLIALLALSLIPAFLSEAHFNNRRYYIDFWRTQEQREREYVRYTASNAETAKEIKIFGLAGFLIERYRRLAAELYAAHRKLAIQRASWGGLFTAIGTAGYYAAYAYIVWRTVKGELTIGDLTFLAGSFQRLHGLIQGMLGSFSWMATQTLYLDDLFSFFEVRPKITSPPAPRPFPEAIREGFVFEDVGFQYPGTDKWAVRHLDFTLRAGEVLALVGENGAGKTTLVKLLTRLYDPNEGRILLDGHDLREYDLEALRSSVGVIFQDFVRYAFTAADNIAAGRIEAREDRTRIERAAARSQADEVVARLPAGYGQMIGKKFESGIELSGGEWQKVAIARAYMREAAVLILDEPTAALDARAEYEVFRRFKELIAGRTAILISHRFSSVRMADRILVLADGTVEAQGAHEELVARPGRYAELFELQAAGYR